MNVRRRLFLKCVAGGVALSSLGGRVAASGTDRVFVHPTTGLLEDVLDAVGEVDGTTIFEYDNFPFVAAEIPANRRDDLLADVRIAFIEDDDVVGVPSGWVPSVSDILDSGGESDCSLHPEQRPSWGWERIGADAVEVDGAGVDVGVLDTGIESEHCSLTVAGGRNFTDDLASDDYEDRHGHGTHVAGIAGALDNDLGVVGVAPGANLYAVKVLDDSGSGRYSTLVAGIDWCMSNDVELISMSLGGESESSTVDRAITEAYSAGHLLLCAAGNEGNNGDGSCREETMTYPATHEDVVAITAMNEDDTLASYSSVGAAVDLLAPGTNVDSTYVDNEYAQASGTSVACPFVTGVAALLWQQRDGEGPGPNEPVRKVLLETAEGVLETCEEGRGLVNARAAADDDRTTDDDRTADDDRTTDDDGTTDGEDRDATQDNGSTATEWSTSAFERLVDVIAGIFEWLRALFR